MVHYIFSDKTGTLTQNVMEFKRFSAGQFEYGKDDPKPYEYPPGVTNVNFEDQKFYDLTIKTRLYKTLPSLWTQVNQQHFFSGMEHNCERTSLSLPLRQAILRDFSGRKTLTR